MGNVVVRTIVLGLLFCLATADAFAMKPAPESVDPAENDEYRVLAVNNTAECYGIFPEGGVIEVFDADDGSFLYWMAVYRKNVVNGFIGENIYITDIHFEKEKLVVDNDEGMKFVVDLKNKSVGIFSGDLRKVRLGGGGGKKRCPAKKRD